MFIGDFYIPKFIVMVYLPAILWVYCSFMVACYADRQNRNSALWGMLALVFTPLVGFIAVFIIGHKEPEGLKELIIETFKNKYESNKEMYSQNISAEIAYRNICRDNAVDMDSLRELIKWM